MAENEHKQHEGEKYGTELNGATPPGAARAEAAGANEVVGIGEVGGFLLAEATIGNAEAKKLLAFVAEGGRSRDIPA